MKYLQKEAKKGSVTEQYLLGRKYIQGNNTPTRTSQGIKWLKKAAEKQHTPAALLLGKIYEQGTGVQKDYTKSLHWYKKAAKQGSASASIKLAPLLDKDPEKEFIFYGISLQKVNPFAINYLMKKNGATPLQSESNPHCDKYKTHNLMTGSDRAQVCYTSDNKLAHIDFRFPPSRKQNTLKKIFQRLSVKYGNPQKTGENSLRYIWTSKGVKITFWYNAQYQTAFLRYSLSQKQKLFSKQLKRQNSTSSIIPQK